jgi:hypothetical protein
MSSSIVVQRWFLKDSIARTTYAALGSKAGNETISGDAY